MKIFRQCAAFPFVIVGLVFVLLGILGLVIASRVEGLDRVRVLFRTIAEIYEEHEVIS